MEKFLLLLLLAGLYSFQSLAQEEDTIGSGRAIAYDGIDDYVNLGNVYDELSLPVTISVWVKLGGTQGYAFPVFNSQDNLPFYNGVTFLIQPENISIQYGDGRGENNPAFRRGKAAVINDISGRWVNVTAVMRGASDMDLFLNGRNVGGFYDGSSTYPMDSDSPGDVAKIGYWVSNGITSHFKGLMDELRIYNRSLSANEIRQQMCRRLTGNEYGLIGYWNFDEVSGDTLKDLSPKGYNGVLKGNPTRVFSGAPVGDESVFLYSDYWSGKSISKDSLSVSNISGNPYGVHIYKVNSPPSQTQGLNTTDMMPSYYGVFLADDGSDNVFDLGFGQAAVCSSFQRRDNSESVWTESEIFSQIHSRTEIIPAYKKADLDVDLGEDLLLCDRSSFDLTAGTDPTMKTFLWNTGQTSQTITVNSSGVYSVEVRQDCIIDRDTILVTLLNSPPAFSLGADEQACSINQRTLNPGLEPNGLDFTWQDGSKDTSLQVNDFGTYWLQVQNLCGISADTITFNQKVLKDFKSYNFMSPDNEDNYNQYFVVDDLLVGARLEVFNRWGKEVYESRSYNNEWTGSELPAGIYFYVIYGECFEPQKGTLTIMR